MFDPISLALFNGKLLAICEAMGETLRRSAFSPNIKERLDFSCAIFDDGGSLVSQAAHIPVHLGSMADAMANIIGEFAWHPGDVVMLNDPFSGGTHLPDVTVVQAVFVQDEVIGFVANRAHHAEIGAESPGSMPLSESLGEEGVLIPPTELLAQGKVSDAALKVLKPLGESLSPDFQAQLSAVQLACRQLERLALGGGCQYVKDGFDSVNHHAQRMIQSLIKGVPKGTYRFSDTMDDDGFGAENIAICVELNVQSDCLEFDFSETADQVKGNINCPPSVVVASVFFAINTLLQSPVPPCSGALSGLRITTRKGSLLNPEEDAAVAAGNVETSMRVFDVAMGSLHNAGLDVPAACQGTMNNLAMGSRRSGWSYYETIGGGMGGHSEGAGLTATQCAMTNTMNTPIESLEMHYPLRLNRYCIREGSGGSGIHKGGDGIIREYQFLEEAEVTILTERRSKGPWGIEGGSSGAVGRNFFNENCVPGKVHLQCKAGDVVRIETPGGGAWGLRSELKPPYHSLNEE